MSLAGNTKGGKYHCTIDLLFDWFGISFVTNDNFCFYLQNRLIQTSQTGGQWYSNTIFPGHWSKNGGSSGVIDVYEFLLTLAPWPSWQQVETIPFVNVLPKE
jgi:hypothetical protein